MNKSLIKALPVKKAKAIVLVVLVASTALILSSFNNVQAAYSESKLIDDSLFIDSDSMSVSQIQSWLNANAGFLKSWRDDAHIPFPNSDGTRKLDSSGRVCLVHRATGKTAAQIIYEATNNWQANYMVWKDISGDVIPPSQWASVSSSQIGSCGTSANVSKWPAYDLKTVSPKVILATLQKEQSLITSGGSYATSTGYYIIPPCNISSSSPYWGAGGCTNNHYKLAWAMGYAVPDTGSRNHRFKGFYNQVNWAAWQLRFNYERSAAVANPNCSASSLDPTERGLCWDDSEGLTYSGPMTAGTYVRSSSASPVTYTKYWKISSGSWAQATSSTATFVIGNRATASLYYYTPHACSPPDSCGNLNFFNYYSDWFGTPVADTSKDKVIVGDWNGDGKDTPAIKRGNTYFFDNNNNGDVNDSGDQSYSWGKATDQVIVGDWDGDGADGIGLKRGREYFLDNDLNGRSDTYISWGKATDQVIVGDWYGSPDDKDGLGLKRGNQYFLDFDNNGQSDVSYSWGRIGDQVIVGDWFGSAPGSPLKDKLGLKRGNTYFFDFDNDAHSDSSYSWGKPTDQVIVGDWYDSPNARDSIGLKRNNCYFVDWNNNAGSDVSYCWGRATDKLIAGNWLGSPNGKDSLGLKRASNYFLDWDNNASSNDSFVYSY